MKPYRLPAALLLVALVASPALAETKLSQKEEARVMRAKPKVRPELRACLIERKKGEKKGTIVGAAGGGGTVALAGGNLGKSLLGAGVGAVAGNVVGKEAATSKRCHQLLEANP